MNEKLSLQIQSMADDIDDFIEENPIDEIEDSMSDLDLVIRRIEEMRSQYRSKQREHTVLQPGAGDKDFNDRLVSMKNYIRLGKEQAKIEESRRVGKAR